MNWISWFGLGIVLLLLIPNAVYAAANKNTQPPRTSRILGLAEQAGRYGCMFLMIFHAGLTEFGFASAEGFIAWLAGTGALLVLYWVFWLLYFRAAKPRYALPLAVLSCLIFSAYMGSGSPAAPSGSAVSMVWTYVTEIIFNMLVLVGLVKSSDRIVREMMGLRGMRASLASCNLSASRTQRS